MIAAVAIDAWKLPVFKRHLDAAGFTYSEHPGLTENTLTLQVTYEWLHKLHPIVTAANDECRAISKARKP
jgi:hypothetical protein